MVNFVRKLFTAIILQPFRVGNPNNLRLRGFHGRKSDGSTSAVVFFATMLPVLMVVLFMLAAHRGDNMKTINLYWISPAPISLTALVLLTVIIVSMFKTEGIGRTQRRNEASSYTLQMGFLSLFGLSIILYSCLEVMVTVGCINSEEDILPGYAGHLVSTIALIIYVVLLLVFIALHPQRGLKNTIMMNYFILGVLWMNGSIWFKSFTYRFSEVFELENSTYINGMLDCYHKSKSRHIIQDIRPYTVPITAEFLFLASSYLVKVWPAHQRETADCIFGDAEERRVDNSGPRSIKIAAFVITVVVHTPLGLMSVLVRFVYRSDISTILNLWEYFSICQKLLMLLLTFVGFSYLKPRNPSKWKLTSTDSILFVCMAAKLFRFIVIILSTLSASGHSAKLITSNNLVYLILVFYQTLYVSISRRPELCRHSASRVSVFIRTVFFTVSIGKWVIASFIINEQGSDILTDSIVNVFKDRRVWITMQYLVAPLDVLYDFISAMHFYTLLRSTDR